MENKLASSEEQNRRKMVKLIRAEGTEIRKEEVKRQSLTAKINLPRAEELRKLLEDDYGIFSKPADDIIACSPGSLARPLPEIVEHIEDANTFFSTVVNKVVEEVRKEGIHIYPVDPVLLSAQLSYDSIGSSLRDAIRKVNDSIGIFKGLIDASREQWLSKKERAPSRSLDSTPLPSFSIEKEPVFKEGNASYHSLLVTNNSSRRCARSCEGKLSLEAKEEDTLHGVSGTDRVGLVELTPFDPSDMSVCWHKPALDKVDKISINPKCSERLDILRVVKQHKNPFSDMLKKPVPSEFDFLTKDIPSHFEIPSEEGWRTIHTPLKPKDYKGSIRIESSNIEPTIRHLRIKFNGRDDAEIELE
jgi:hypothetical protein